MTSEYPKGLVALAAALAVAIAAAWPAAAQQGPARVLAERVEIRTVTDTTPLIAEVVATTESRVAARAAGIVSEVLFRVGDRVEKGAPLVRLDRDLIEIRRRTAAAALASAKAGVEVATARMRLAEQAFDRAAGLRGSTAFSKGNFEDLQQTAEQARSELLRAEADVARAEAELARADYDMRHSEILAPFDGVVIERAAQPGSYIDLGEAVGTLIDVRALEVEVNLPARLVDAVEPGMEVRARVSEDQEIPMTVRTLLPVEASTTRTRPVRLTVAPRHIERHRLAAGNSVVIGFPVSVPRDVVTVPKDALVQGNDGWMVFTAEKGAATPRAVSLGIQTGNRMEVLSGLIPGDIVVVRGNERLRPGQPIEARILGEDEGAPGKDGNAGALTGDPSPSQG